ncbi:hypothetical protein HBH98_173050 [Parastagonospora nodorum]|nr:hypothetical protein HBI10_078720 [Parastagonospora nodorum]KAH4039577.1 hypothetical protein HBI09_033780 [Parastagonospora nodorum]KAH4243851.1 hypothetical protein HBI06_005290 [Parastagonospora nodorum]KAH4300417.1 hypothetical protein HBI02_150030 [Parastagonospora nodorum]KAH4341556.1 hypothetical protein HBH98_173050 [Parastagonospora nodorum]
MPTKIMRISYPLKLLNDNCPSRIMPDVNSKCFQETQFHLNHSSMRKQKAMKLARMIPSLLFFDPIRPMRLLMPGTWLAAPTILLLMFASVSRCTLKFSCTA